MIAPAESGAASVAVAITIPPLKADACAVVRQSPTQPNV